MDTRPTVSACVAVYNGEAYLACCLDSIFAQTLLPDEVLVLDDGSTDGSVAIAKGYPGVRVIEQRNAGIGAARKRLVEEARCDWIAFNDHDDLWLPEKLERMIPFTVDPEVSVIYTAAYFVDEAGRKTEAPLEVPPSAPRLLHIVPSHTNILVPATLLRRSALLEVGNYRPDLRSGEDALAYFMLLSRGKVVQIPELLAVIFRRSDSTSAPRRQTYEFELALYERYVLPNWQEWYGTFPAGEQSEALQLIQKKVAHVESILAAWYDWEGDHRRAIEMYKRSFRRRPLAKGNLYRAARAIVGVKTKPPGAVG